MKELESPLLNIQMRPTTFCGIEGSITLDEIRDRFDVLRSKEGVYAPHDYLRLFPNKSTIPVTYESERLHPNERIDAICRERMCEWCFKVVDHFRTPRDVVGIAFSYLDRFASYTLLDRSRFKLASMTCLYLATKITNAKQFSICTLSELSRGEFTTDDIADMELEILRALDWRLSPPTPQAFVYLICDLIELEDDALRPIIRQKATFLAELTAYDYSFIVKKPSSVAFACVLLAIEHIGDLLLAQCLRLDLISALSLFFSYKLDEDHLHVIEERLLYLYSCSAEAINEEEFPLIALREHGITVTYSVELQGSCSPKSVLPEKA